MDLAYFLDAATVFKALNKFAYITLIVNKETDQSDRRAPKCSSLQHK